MSTLLRSFWFATASVLYVAFASLQANSRGPYAWAVLVLGPVVLWFTWRHTGTLVRPGEQDPETRRDCIRAAVTGSVLFLGARTGPLGHPGFDAAANLGVGITLVAANVALSKIQTLGGLLAAPPTTRSLDAAIFSALLWGIATALPTLRSVVTSSLLLLDPIAIDYATVTASMASLLLMWAVTLRLRLLRRLELDVADRAISTLIVASVALLATLPALLLELIPPDRAVPAVVVLSSLFYVWASSTADAKKVTSALRASLAILTFLSPLVLFLAILSRRWPAWAPILVVGAATISVILGLGASRLARPLAPEQSRWLDSIDKASEAALVPDPDDALRATLFALGPIAPGPSSRVELWRLQPQSVLFVDIAGQLHEEVTQVPWATIELAAAEPERTLRTEVLRAVQVRNPKAREALSHFETRHVHAATLLTSESGPLGLIALPEGHRRSPLSLEEVVALRRLADRLESVLAITSAQARSRQRELEALAQVAQLSSESQRLAQALKSDGERQRRFAERYARLLRPNLYSPSARATQIAVERLAQTSPRITLVLSPGSDALGWASLVHLASARRDGPFVVFDALGSDFEREHWDDPTSSPIAIATTGTWVLLNPQALAPEQVHVAVQALIQFQASHAIDTVPATGFVLACHCASRSDQSPIHCPSELAALFPSEATIVIPSLAERAEDLRALVYDRAARLGTVLIGRPLGVDPTALGALLDYDWPLNDLELDSTMHTLVLAAEGNVITADTLDRIGFDQRLAKELATGRVDVPTRRSARPSTRSIRPRDR